MTDSQETKDKLESEIEFANIGKKVIDNPAFQQAMTIRKAQIFDVFCKTKQDQTDVREEAWRTMQNMNALEQYFKQLLTTGKMAEETLKSYKPQD